MDNKQKEVSNGREERDSKKGPPFLERENCCVGINEMKQDKHAQ